MPCTVTKCIAIYACADLCQCAVPRCTSPCPALASRGCSCPAADRPGVRQEALGEAVTLFPSHRHHLNQQHHPARYMPPAQVGYAGKQPFCPLWCHCLCSHIMACADGQVLYIVYRQNASLSFCPFCHSTLIVCITCAMLTAECPVEKCLVIFVQRFISHACCGQA